MNELGPKDIRWPLAYRGKHRQPERRRTAPLWTIDLIISVVLIWWLHRVSG